MKRFFIFVLCAAGVFAASPAPAEPQAGGNIVIQGARVIDAVSDAPIENAVIVIENERIRAIGAAGSVQIPADARTLNMAGKTIMPGLVNLHGHIGRRYQMEYGPEYYSFGTVHRDANSYLYFGVTHSTSLGQDWAPMKEFIRAQRAGQAGGSRLYTGEFGFTVEGGFQGQNPVTHKPRSPEEAREMVRAMAADGPIDLIKMWVDGQGPKLSPEVAGAIIAEAHMHGLKTFVHLSGVEDARELIRRGIDILAHIPRDKELDDEFVRLAVQNGVTQTANLVSLLGGRNYLEPDFLNHAGLRVMFPDVIDVINTPEYIARQTTGGRGGGPQAPNPQYEIALRNLLKLHRAGVPIGIGTDSGMAGQFQGIWEHRDMMLLVQDAGLSPMEAIRAATINGARALGVDDDYGSLEGGKVADFIVLNSDPLAAIGNSLDIDSVWMNGQEVDRSKLPVDVVPATER